ncbi:YraN family protein [Amnibacterium kyonggiense]
MLRMAQKDDLGRRGEDQAAAYLTGLGWRIVDRNWRCPRGEIDIVALDGTELVIVEVKTRSGRGYGDPLEAVDPRKLTRLCVLAGAWRRAHRDVRARTTRIDLVGVLVARHREPVLDHLRAAA